MESGKFIQIVTAPVRPDSCPGRSGQRLEVVEGGQPRVSEPKWILMKYERQR